MSSCPVNSPGSTRHSCFPESEIFTSTFAPKILNISIVISICGTEGSEFPISLIVIPVWVAGPISNSAEINWLEDEASISNVPPLIEPLALIVSGSE